MKRYIAIAVVLSTPILLIVFGFPVLMYAQVAPDIAPFADLPDLNRLVAAPVTQSEFLIWFESAFSARGAGALAISSVIIQGAMLAVRQWVVKGSHKLLALSGLSLALAVVNGLVEGYALGVILVSGAVLYGIQNTLHQIYLQFFVKKT